MIVTVFDLIKAILYLITHILLDFISKTCVQIFHIHLLNHRLFLIQKCNLKYIRTSNKKYKLFFNVTYQFEIIYFILICTTFFL